MNNRSDSDMKSWGSIQSVQPEEEEDEEDDDDDDDDIMSKENIKEFINSKMTKTLCM